MALSFLDQAQAIVWAQWRTLVNYYPRSNRLTAGVSFLLTFGWYAGWAMGAITLASKLATLADLRTEVK